MKDEQYREHLKRFLPQEDQESLRDQMAELVSKAKNPIDLRKMFKESGMIEEALYYAVYQYHKNWLREKANTKQQQGRIKTLKAKIYDYELKLGIKNPWWAS